MKWPFLTFTSTFPTSPTLFWSLQAFYRSSRTRPSHYPRFFFFSSWSFNASLDNNLKPFLPFLSPTLDCRSSMYVRKKLSNFFLVLRFCFVNFCLQENFPSRKRVGVSVCVREKVCVCVCVCVRERKRKRRSWNCFALQHSFDPLNWVAMGKQKNVKKSFSLALTIGIVQSHILI